MKKTCLAVVVVFVVGAFGSVYATNLTSRYRGRTAAEFSTFQQKNQQISPRSSLFSRRLPESMRSGTSITKKTSTTRRTGIGLRRNNKKVRSSAQRDDQTLVTIPEIQFWAELPSGFETTNTDISWEKGTARFERGTEWIELVATGDRCDGGSSYSQRCLRFFADEISAELKTEFPYARILRNQRVTRDRGYEAGFFQKTNTGWWFLLEDGTDREGVLTFFDPTNEYLWYLRIHSSGEVGKFLADARNWTQVFESLFEDPTAIKSSSRNTVEYVRGRR